MFPSYLSAVAVEKTIEEAKKELREIESRCSDLVVDTSEAFLYDGEYLKILGNANTLGFTDTGLDQFGRFLGIRSGFFRKLKPETRKAVYTDVLPDACTIQKTAKVRLFDTNVRAVLSEGYTPVSVDALLNELVFSGFEEKNLSVRLWADYESTDLVVMNKTEIDCSDAAGWRAGLIFRNDDVGRRSASIESFLYNEETKAGIILGKVMKNIYKFNHTKNIEGKLAKAIVYSVDKVGALFGESGININGLMMTKALEMERARLILKSYEVKDRELDAIYSFEKLASGSGYSVWDLINAVSVYSTKIDDRERTLELMRVAGIIVENPSSFSIQ